MVMTLFKCPCCKIYYYLVKGYYNLLLSIKLIPVEFNCFRLLFLLVNWNNLVVLENGLAMKSSTINVTYTSNSIKFVHQNELEGTLPGNVPDFLRRQIKFC